MTNIEELITKIKSGDEEAIAELKELLNKRGDSSAPPPPVKGNAPPPPPPPPPSNGSTDNSSSQNSSSAAGSSANANRGSLLDDIRRGAKLKETNVKKQDSGKKRSDLAEALVSAFKRKSVVFSSDDEEEEEKKSDAKDTEENREREKLFKEKDLSKEISLFVSYVDKSKREYNKKVSETVESIRGKLKEFQKQFSEYLESKEGKKFYEEITKKIGEIEATKNDLTAGKQSSTKHKQTKKNNTPLTSNNHAGETESPTADIAALKQQLAEKDTKIAELTDEKEKIITKLRPILGQNEAKWPENWADSLVKKTDGNSENVELKTLRQEKVVLEAEVKKLEKDLSTINSQLNIYDENGGLVEANLNGYKEAKTELVAAQTTITDAQNQLGVADLKVLATAMPCHKKADGSNANQAKLADLIKWFEWLSIITGSDGTKRGLNVLSKIDGKIQTDLAKLKSYRDSKIITYKVKAANIPNLFNQDGTVNEGVLGKIAPALANNTAGEVMTDLVLKNQIIADTKTYLNIPDLTQNNLKPYKDAYTDLPTLQTQLNNANIIITNAENYLGLGTKKLEDIMDAGIPNGGINPHADYLELPTDLESLIHWYKENDKLFDARANGLEIFVRNTNNGNATAIDLDLVENYAQSLNRLGLTDFQTATITNKLGTKKLSDIPTGKTLTDLLTGCPFVHCPLSHANYDTIKDTLDDYQNGFRQILELDPTDPLPTNFNDLANLHNSKSGTQTVPQLKTKADHHDRIHTKLKGKVSDAELDTLLSNSPQCSHTDYDDIKTERDQLKTHKCDCDSKVAQKETEIITKIITDLGLSTERERERERMF